MLRANRDGRHCTAGHRLTCAVPKMCYSISDAARRSQHRKMLLEQGTLGGLIILPVKLSFRPPELRLREAPAGLRCSEAPASLRPGRLREAPGGSGRPRGGSGRPPGGSGRPLGGSGRPLGGSKKPPGGLDSQQNFRNDN